MRIRQKLLASFLFISLLTLGVSFGINLLIQEKTMAMFQEVGGEILPGDIALSRMTTELYHTLVLLDKYEANLDDRIRGEIEKTLSSLDTHKTIHDLFHREDELTSQIEQLIQEFNRSVAQYVLLLQKEAGKEEVLAARQKIDTLLEQFVHSINPNIEKDFEISYQKITDVQEMNHLSRRILVVGSGVILFITLLLSVFIADLFSKPLRALRDAAKQIGIGRLDITLPVTSQDEIGDLAQAFNDMSENLATMQVEEERLEQALRRTQKMDAIGQLTGGIAHDFNNILAIILGNIELLKLYMTPNDKANKRIDSIQKAAERAANLTKQLLGFSRPQATRVITADINRLIEEMDNLLTRSLTPEVEVKCQFAEDLWLTNIDPGNFENALLNLSINARDAMAGHGHLTIETRNATLDAAYCRQHADATPGEYVELAVSDSGEGIPPEQQEHIFEPFFTTKEQGKGTGLGLAMVYGFVKRSGGYIKCYSEVGIGTTFRLYLPRAEGVEEPIIPTSELSEALPRGTETLLIVDDEAGLLELAKESLEALGYRVLAASDGQEALERLAKEPTIDLLFSDVVMPGGINGYQLAEQATASRPDLKVLLTSGYTEKAVARNGQARFTANLLSKPYSQAELARRLRAQLGEPQRGSSERDDSEQVPAQPAVTTIDWTDAFSVGVTELDDDHHVLLSLLNRSQLAAAKGDEIECITILKQVQEYTQVHFQREELVMAACNYSGLDSHRQVHQLLIRQVGKMQRQLKQGELNTDELVAFLGSWLVDHIQGMDRAYASQCENKAGLITQALEQAGIAPPLENEK